MSFPENKTQSEKASCFGVPSGARDRGQRTSNI